MAGVDPAGAKVADLYSHHPPLSSPLQVTAAVAAAAGVDAGASLLPVPGALQQCERLSLASR